MSPPREPYEVIYERVWEDPAFLALGCEARLLFLWSWTHPRAAISGLYPAAVGELAAALGPAPLGVQRAPRERVQGAVGELGRKPLLRYDPKAGVVWVVNRASYANVSPKVAKRMAREYVACPDCKLKREFAARYRAQLRLGAES